MQGGESDRAFFFLGVALYKMDHHQAAINAFQRSTTIKNNCAEAHYNLAISYAKNNKPRDAVEHFKRCIELEPQHPWAYNNLAFLYNVHSSAAQNYYYEAKIVCETAAKRFPKGNHNCYRHWAYAEFKQMNLGEAFKKINLAV